MIRCELCGRLIHAGEATGPAYVAVDRDYASITNVPRSIPIWQLKITDVLRLALARNGGEDHAEVRAAAGGALDVDAAVVCTDELTDDRESDPRPARCARA